MDHLLIQGLAINTVIGVHAPERLHRQPIMLDIDLAFDARPAAQADSLALTLDYEQLIMQLRQFVEQQRYELIEALAEAIATHLLQIPRVNAVEVKLTKPAASYDAKQITLMIRRPFVAALC